MLIAPVWSPDGSRIAFLEVVPKDPAHAGDPAPERWVYITTVDPGSGVTTRVREAGSCYCVGFAPTLTWSPDGTELAAIMGPATGTTAGVTGLYVMAPDGTGLRLLRRDVNGPVLAWRPV